jgi:3-hydroxyacyl-CoA dehydrogenase/enoyl-CoA hydratase/3-hydroxybutyryl-CoA epimerase
MSGAVDCGIRRVGVVGAGVMGSGIAQWIAAHGYDVVLRDAHPAALARGAEVVRGLFAGAVRRGRLTEAAAAAGVQRIAATTGWDGFAACDLVIEAIIEDVAAKRRLFGEIAAVARPDAIIASNTSALPLEEFCGHIPRPERTLGLHFFNPVGRMALVELVVAGHTAQAVRDRARDFLRSLGKQPVTCRSAPGFLVTRVLFFYLNEAVRLWESGVDTAAIDGALRAYGWPMGPLRLIDEVGLDVTDFIFGELAHYFPGRFGRTTACARLVAAGLVGRKNGTGRGFYRYERGEALTNEAEARPLYPAGAGRTPEDPTAHLMQFMVAEARRCLAEGVVASAADVEVAMRLGAGFPAARPGLLADPSA